MNRYHSIALLLLSLGIASLYVNVTTGTLEWLVAGIAFIVLAFVSVFFEQIKQFEFSALGITTKLSTNNSVSADKPAVTAAESTSGFDILIRSLDSYLLVVVPRWAQLSAENNLAEAGMYLRYMADYLGSLVDDYGRFTTEPINHQLVGAVQGMRLQSSRLSAAANIGNTFHWNVGFQLLNQVKDSANMMKTIGPIYEELLEQAKINIAKPLGSDNLRSLLDPHAEMQIEIARLKYHDYLDLFTHTSEFDPANKLYQEINEQLRLGEQIVIGVPNSICRKIADAIHDWVALGFVELGNYAPGMVHGVQRERTQLRLFRTAYRNIREGRVIIYNNPQIEQWCVKFALEADTWVARTHLER